MSEVIYSEPGLEIAKQVYRSQLTKFKFTTFIVHFDYADGEYYNYLFDEEDLPMVASEDECILHIILIALDSINNN